MTVVIEYAPFDVSDYLDNDEMIAEYLTAAAEDDNPDVLLLALANVAKAHGMAKVAKAAGLGRESLYKALAPGSHPRFETIVAVLRALGVTVVVRGSKPAGCRSAQGLQADPVEADQVQDQNHRSEGFGQSRRYGEEAHARRAQACGGASSGETGVIKIAVTAQSIGKIDKRG